MIQEYQRPNNLQEALKLLNRISPRSIPLGGGSGISRMTFTEPIAVIDLQNLMLDQMEKREARVSIGSTAKLQSIADWDGVPTFLREAILKDANANLRNVATLGGSLIRLTGKSRMACVLLAADCHLMWEPGGMDISLGDWIALGKTSTRYRLMTGIYFDNPQSVTMEEVTQTPGGIPLVSVCMARWKTGRIRIVVSEASRMPDLLCDGKGIENVKNAINARSHISSKYTSSIYQKTTISTLIQRLIDQEK